MPSLTCPADALGHPFRPTPATSSEGPGGCLSPWRPNPRPTPSTKRRFPIPRHFATLFRRRSPPSSSSRASFALPSSSPKRENLSISPRTRLSIYIAYGSSTVLASFVSSRACPLSSFFFPYFSLLLRFFDFFDKIAEYQIFFCSSLLFLSFFTTVYFCFFSFHIILEYLRD